MCRKIGKRWILIKENTTSSYTIKKYLKQVEVLDE